MKDYFSHDYNSRNDKKLVKAFMRYGLESIGAYWCIVEMLYEEGGYLLLSEYDRITFELRPNNDLIRFLIYDSELFKNDGEKFWSETAIERLKLRSEKSEKARKSIESRWNRKNNTNVIRTNEERNTNKVKESKEKESKEILISKIQKEFYESLKQYTNEFTPKVLREFYDYWSEPNKSMTKIKWQLEKTWDSKKRLIRWANNNFNKDEKTFRTNRTDKNAETVRAAEDLFERIKASSGTK